MEVNIITEAVKFMFLGMGVVFAFLTIMIFVLKAQALILTKFFPQEEKETTISNINNSTIDTNFSSVNTNTQSAKIAAIIAAVQHHRNLKG